MVMQVLQSKSQIVGARQELINKDASSIESKFCSVLRRLGLVRGVLLGDKVKSWDVLETLNFIERHIEKNQPILDIGCYASELIVSLHKMGYVNLTGVDLNPKLNQMPYQESIQYVTTDFMQTKFVDASFRGITSISVIEHGFDGAALLKEISRLLCPGGFFIASFDYWPDKIDTTGIKFFGMDWEIFSKNDIEKFIELASSYGLVPEGDLHFDASEKPIECAGKNYTFGWLVLSKKV